MDFGVLGFGFLGIWVLNFGVLGSAVLGFWGFGFCGLQELCILLDEYWERLGLTVPIYFSAGLTAQATVYYKMLLSWTNQKVQKAPLGRSTVDFSHGNHPPPSPSPSVIHACHKGWS